MEEEKQEEPGGRRQSSRRGLAYGFLIGGAAGFVVTLLYLALR